MITESQIRERAARRMDIRMNQSYFSASAGQRPTHRMQPRTSTSCLVGFATLYSIPALTLLSSVLCLPLAIGFSPGSLVIQHQNHYSRGKASAGRFMSDDDWNDYADKDSNKWVESSMEDPSKDWRDELSKRKDGEFWNTFEPTDESTDELQVNATAALEDVDQTEAWLDTATALFSEEVEYNRREAERADTARQMEEWGFDSETISNTLGVAVSDELEKDEVQGMQTYRETAYDEDLDWSEVESHTKVEKDEETGEPIRQQMVYVDEHTCIGCTNCAMIAQSTFFMHDEHGRARVFNQWGDDDETIQIAIETCPVDCIHYVPYDELVRLEVERRDQNINFKARLVSQGEYGGASLSHRVGGPNAFTAPQQISGNAGSRCNNCPSRGCKNCPMFGVGKNPEYERKEKERKAKIERRRLEKTREESNKSAEL